MKRVLLIADDPAFVRGIRPALRNAAALRVVAVVDGRGSARPSLTRFAPDVVVVDEMCQRTNVMARLREVQEEAPGARVVLLTAARGGAGQAGADAVVFRRLHASALAGRLHGLLAQEAATSA